jgi:hypothetical protein
MSGASIDEHRQDIGLRLSSYHENLNLAFSGGHSQEDDYQASYLGVDLELASADHNNAFRLGATVSQDELAPSDAELYGRISEGEKQSLSWFLAWSRVLSPKSLVQLSLSLSNHSGFLSDPYKLLDVRPDTRFQLAGALKWRQYIGWAGSALQFDYRYYQDDWGVTSDTFTLAWHQPLADGWAVRPGLRYYTQSHADFFRLAGDDSDTGYQSTDYRLADYGAVSYSLHIEKSWRQWLFHVSVERYDSDSGYALDPVRYQHPALVDFTRTSGGVSWRF